MSPCSKAANPCRMSSTFSCDIARPVSRAKRAPGLVRFVAGGQSLVACPRLNIALELFRTCRRCATRVANDAYDLAHASASTATPSRHGHANRSLAVNAAAVTDRVRGNRYGRDLQ